MDQENKNTTPEEELMTEETAEAVEAAEPAEEAAPEQKKGKKKKSREAEALEKCEAEKKELEDRYLRLMAEYENYRRRTQKERENVYPDAVANTLKELLPLLDNLQRALDTPCADENYLTGIKMIQTGFEEYLKKMGVETFGKAGEPFDPNLHNAVMHIEDESLGKNVVAQVFQIGAEQLGDHGFHGRAHFAVAQTSLGLPLELRRAHHAREHARQPFAKILARQVGVLFL